MCYTQQKKEEKKKVGVLLQAAHASDRPINLCQSGNRPVNIEGPGCRGGNGRGKGSLAPPSHLTAPTTSSHFLPDNPYLILYLTLYHLIATWLGHGGRDRDKRAGSHHPKNLLSDLPIYEIYPCVCQIPTKTFTTSVV